MGGNGSGGSMTSPDASRIIPADNSNNSVSLSIMNQPGFANNNQPTENKTPLPRD